MQNIINIIEKKLQTIHGWCTLEKAKKLIEYIVNIKPDLCVEIGVFGGSSFIPQALAIKQNGKGKIFGIDPWTNVAALEEMQEPKNIDWWGKLQINEIYNHFLQNLDSFGVKDISEIIRDKAENVCNNFADQSIDFLHIDGNHSENLAYKDAILYFPKVKMGGYIFFDDIYWCEDGVNVSTRKAINYLLQYCDKVEIIDNDCLIMQKVRSA